MKTANCPACGATIQFESSIALLTVCQYCRSAAIRTDLDLKNLGKVAALKEDGSPIVLGVRGEHDGVPFSVVGRIQLEFDSGLWNEWFITFRDGKAGWLGEASGHYTVSFLYAGRAEIPPLGTLVIDHPLQIDGRTYQVRNIETATYASAEGELPNEIPLGETATLVDLGGPDDRFATLDFSETPCLVFLGTYSSFDRLKLHGVKRFEGW